MTRRRVCPLRPPTILSFTDLRNGRRSGRRQTILVADCFSLHQQGCFQGQARTTREQQLSLKVGRCQCRHAPTRTSRRVSGIKAVSVEIHLHERASSQVRATLAIVRIFEDERLDQQQPDGKRDGERGRIRNYALRAISQANVTNP